MADRKQARALTSIGSRIAQETFANRRYIVSSLNDDGTINVAKAHWPAGKTIKVPRGTRSHIFEGDTVLCSQVDGTLEAHNFSAYGGGALPT